MDNSSLPLIYKTLLSLKWKNLSLKAGLCFSQVTFQQLKEGSSSFLHPMEESYFRGLTHPRRQHSYLLGRYCAKQALIACCNDVDVEEVAIKAGVFDHPVVVCGLDASLQVSISHTSDFGAALAFPETHPMAIDVETICSSKSDTIRSQLTLTEQKLWSSLHKEGEDEATQLTLLWTVKEALSKALRCGLTVPFEILEIETIRETEGFVISTFKNFKQYQAISFCLEGNVCSIVHPFNTSFSIDINGIQRSLQE